MKTSNMRVGKFSSIVGRIMMALVIASMIGGISVTPAFADDHDRGRGHQERGRESYGHYHGHRPYGYGYPAPVYAPVYAPPPVVYAPAPYQSPGISLVFPIHIR